MNIEKSQAEDVWLAIFKSYFFLNPEMATEKIIEKDNLFISVSLISSP